ncbi:MAG: hypothetical protein JWN95_2654 [Frankiales bacterium]|nr:hypothetical protein [Frankiales bacterium]
MSLPGPYEAVTAIIPTHNRRELLARTLHSVLAQKDVDLRVIVVDDGGSDGSEASIAALDDDRVTYLRHSQPRGVSAARNTGIAAATTTWLAFVDDDDLWSPVKVRSQLEALRADPSAGWSCTGSVNIDPDTRPLGWFQPPTEPDIGSTLLTRNVIPGGGSGVLVSRELTVAAGGFDEALSNLADWDFYIRIGLRSRVASVDRPHLGYYIHPQGMAHDVPRSVREYHYVDVKYGVERRAHGVELERIGWLVYLSGMAYRGGRRWTGMRMHAELVGRHRRWRSLRAIVMGLAPERLRVSRASRMPFEGPPGWATEAAEWLAPYESGWLG